MVCIEDVCTFEPLNPKGEARMYSEVFIGYQRFSVCLWHRAAINGQDQDGG